MSANETAREFLRRRFNGGKQLLDITLKEDQAAEFAEAYHSSQMSGIAQRAAEKIAREFLQPLKFSSQAYDIGIAAWAKYIAAIISQEGNKL